MSIKKDVKEILSWLGLIVLGGSLGAGGAWLALDINQNIHAKKGEGLPLMVEGVHLKEGNHRVVITDQFYEILTYDNTPKEDVDLAIGGIKQAYVNLNELNSKLNFNLCTTVDAVATEYNIPKIDSYSSKDIPLYLTTETIQGNKQVLAKTDWKYNSFTYEMKDESITYKRDGLFAVWKEYPTIEETLSPYNSAAYTITAHESMHLMGFAHVDDHESILNTYLSYKSPKDFTEYDKKIIDKYNVQFYGAEPTYVEPVTTETATYTTAAYLPSYSAALTTYHDGMEY